MNGVNDFDNSNGLHSVQQLPSLGNTSFMDGMNNFNVSVGVRAASQPPPGDVFAIVSSNFETSHEDVFDSSSFKNSMNNFDIVAGQEDTLNPMGQ